MDIINNVQDIISKAKSHQYYDSAKEGFVTLSHWSGTWRRIFACFGVESSIVYCMKRSLKFVKNEICLKDSSSYLGPNFIKDWNAAPLTNIKNVKLLSIALDIQNRCKVKQAINQEIVLQEQILKLNEANTTLRRKVVQLNTEKQNVSNEEIGKLSKEIEQLRNEKGLLKHQFEMDLQKSQKDLEKTKVELQAKTKTSEKALISLNKLQTTIEHFTIQQKETDSKAMLELKKAELCKKELDEASKVIKKKDKEINRLKEKKSDLEKSEKLFFTVLEMIEKECSDETFSEKISNLLPKLDEDDVEDEDEEAVAANLKVEKMLNNLNKRIAANDQSQARANEENNAKIPGGPEMISEEEEKKFLEDQDINLLLEKAKALLKDLDPEIIESLRKDPHSANALKAVCSEMLKREKPNFNIAIGFANKILDKNLKSGMFEKICWTALVSLNDKHIDLKIRLDLVEILLLNCIDNITNNTDKYRVINSIYSRLTNLAENDRAVDALILGLNNIAKAKDDPNLLKYLQSLFTAVINFKQIDSLKILQSIRNALPIIKTQEKKYIIYIFDLFFNSLLCVKTRESLELALAALSLFTEKLEFRNDEYRIKITEALAKIDRVEN